MAGLKYVSNFKLIYTSSTVPRLRQSLHSFCPTQTFINKAGCSFFQDIRLLVTYLRTSHFTLGREREIRMITTMNTSSQQFEDPMVLLSQVYSAGLYTEATVPPQGESKPRRRRRKNKAAAAGAESDALGMKKRKLSEEQVRFLEMSFDDEHKLESDRKDKLALELGLDPRQVAVWFQNRRARWKNKKLEEEYSKLKSAHENVVVEKCRLETEILKLKDQLGEAENEIRRLSGPSSADGAITINSPTSSLSMGAVDPPFLGEFGVDMDGYDDVFYMQANSYMNGMDWFNMYM